MIAPLSVLPNSASAQRTVEAQFHVIAPDKKPNGNFWDSATGGVLTGRVRGILPDMVICTNSPSLRQICAPVCNDSRECTVTLQVIPNEPLTVIVYDADIQHHDPMYKMTIDTPGKCTPCRVGDGKRKFPVTVTVAPQTTPIPTRKPFCLHQDYGRWITSVTKCEANPSSAACVESKKEQDTAIYKTFSLLNNKTIQTTSFPERLDLLDSLLVAPLKPKAEMAISIIFSQNPGKNIHPDFDKLSWKNYSRIASILRKDVEPRKFWRTKELTQQWKNQRARKVVETIVSKFGKSPPRQLIWATTATDSRCSKKHGFYDAQNDSLVLCPSKYMPGGSGQRWFYKTLIEEVLHKVQHDMVSEFCSGKSRSQPGVRDQAKMFLINKAVYGSQDNELGLILFDREIRAFIPNVFCIEARTATYCNQPLEYHAKEGAGFITEFVLQPK